MNEQKKAFLLKISSYAAAVIIGGGGITFGGAALYTGGHPLDFFHFMKTYHMVKANYFRPIDEDALWEGAASGMVDSLEDPYSKVLAGDDYSSFMESTSGEYGGIGVVMGLDRDSKVRIFNVFPDSAAEKAGLKAGDEILSVDGTDIGELGLTGTAQAVRGDNGTEVALEVLRNGETLDFDVTRSNITLPTVLSRMVKDNIGYIHIFTFSRHTPEEFKKQLSALKDQGCEKLIIDVRMNPGGMIDSVVAIADQILSKGTVVSYNAKSLGSEVYSVKGVENPMPMAVLIDKNSASASEILAGAVQDRKEGTIIGERSYGKGTVQAVFDQGNKTAVKVSIAEYKTPSGRSIDKVGITPDIPVQQTGSLFQQTGSLFHPDTDNVLQKAIEVLEGE